MIGRRALFAGLGGAVMTAGDRIQRAGTGRQPAPMNRPPAQQLSIGVQPGSPNVIVARRVVIFGSGANQGLFVYSGTPALGNLIASIAAVAGTDPYGNTYPQGISSTAGNIDSILFGGQLQFKSETDPAFGPPIVQSTPSGTNGNSIQINTGQGKNTTTAGALNLYDSLQAGTVSGLPAGKPGGFLGPLGTSIIADTWHNMPAMSAGWAIGGFAKYRYTPVGDLQVAFQQLSPGTDTDATVIWAAASLPSQYQPAHTERVVCYTDTLRQPSAGIFSGAALLFGTDGSVQCFGIAAAATRVDLFATIPLTA